MFYRNLVFNGDLGAWDVSSVTDMGSMFFGAQDFNKDIGKWPVSRVEDMSSMFYGASLFNQSLGGWDVSSVEDMSDMFYRARAFNQNIGDWNVSSVTNMTRMFNFAEVFNQDIGEWDVSNVTTMTRMFGDAYAFNQDLTGWCVTNIASEPSNFSVNSPLTEANKPIWGSCGGTSVETEEIPSEFVLEQNYPNPFNPSTQIRFSLPQAIDVRVEVFSITGQSIGILVDGRMGAGVHTLEFNATEISGGLSSGIYLYRLTTPEFTQTRVMHLLK